MLFCFENFLYTNNQITCKYFQNADYHCEMVYSSKRKVCSNNESNIIFLMCLFFVLNGITCAHKMGFLASDLRESKIPQHWSIHKLLEQEREH